MNDEDIKDNFICIKYEIQACQSRASEAAIRSFYYGLYTALLHELDMLVSSLVELE